MAWWEVVLFVYCTLMAIICVVASGKCSESALELAISELEAEKHASELDATVMTVNHLFVEMTHMVEEVRKVRDDKVDAEPVKKFKGILFDVLGQSVVYHNGSKVDVSDSEEVSYLKDIYISSNLNRGCS